MAKERAIQLALVIVIVALLVLNVFQFLIYSGDGNGIEQEDVPIQIDDLKGDDWEEKIGDKVSVEGYYVENNGIAMLIADPNLIELRRPLNTTEYIKLDAPLPEDAEKLGKYLVKGEVMESVDVSERVYIDREKFSIITSPIVEYPQFFIDFEFTPSLEHSSTKYALLISGGFTEADAWPSFWNDLKKVYSVLVSEYYYDTANIYVLYNDGVGEDAQIPVDFAATVQNLETVLAILADTMYEEDTLLFYVTDHGGQWGTGGAEPGSASTDVDEYIALWNKGGYYDDWLKAKLDLIPCSKAILIFDLCHAGGFTWDLSRSDRIILGACLEDMNAHDHPSAPNGDFTFNLFNALTGYWWTGADKDQNGKVSIAEAFNYAAIMSRPDQTPTYDDNGDGVAHYGNIPNGGMVEDEGRLGDTYL